MSAPQSAKAALAAARVLAGEPKATVSRETGVSRSTIDRHLAAMEAEAFKTALAYSKPEPTP